MSAGGYAARISADLAVRLRRAGVGPSGLRRVLGCSWVHAVALLAGWRSWDIDEVAVVAGHLGVSRYGVAMH